MQQGPREIYAPRVARETGAREQSFCTSTEEHPSVVSVRPWLRDEQALHRQPAPRFCKGNLGLSSSVLRIAIVHARRPGDVRRNRLWVDEPALPMLLRQLKHDLRQFLWGKAK